LTISLIFPANACESDEESAGPDDPARTQSVEDPVQQVGLVRSGNVHQDRGVDFQFRQPLANPLCSVRFPTVTLLTPNTRNAAGLIPVSGRPGLDGLRQDDRVDERVLWEPAFVEKS